MTRRDFIRIAATLRAADAPTGVRSALAEMLATTNPRFDHDRFMRESEPKVPQEGAQAAE